VTVSASRWLRSLARLVLVAVALIISLAPGPIAAESGDACELVSTHPAGVLLRCGSQLKSLVIAYEDVRRQRRHDPQGVFHFVCPIEEMCDGQPRISGWMIDHTKWRTSERNDAAVFELLRQPPIILRGAAKPVDIASDPLKSTCGVFDLELAGLRGQGVCYDFGESQSTTIVAVVSNDEIGFVLLFNQRNAELTPLRETVDALLPRFKLERASGDAYLMRWMMP
jgi:hypothetical protein